MQEFNFLCLYKVIEMALYSDLYDRFDMKRRAIKGKDDKFLRMETDKELRDRLDKEEKEQYNKNIKRIMNKGFNKKQAEYLYEMECKIHEAARTYVPPPIF